MGQVKLQNFYLNGNKKALKHSLIKHFKAVKLSRVDWIRTSDPLRPIKGHGPRMFCRV